jgi:hypothetical protein
MFRIRIAASLFHLLAALCLAACQSSSPVDLYASTLNAINARNWERAEHLASELLRIDPEPRDHMLLAMIHSGQGQADPAFAELAIAIEQGAADPGSADWPDMLASDPIWDPIRRDPRFAPLVAKATALRWKPDPLRFDLSSPDQPARFRFSPPNNLYLTRLRRLHKLDELVQSTTSDLDRVKRICHWVHAQAGDRGWRRGLPPDPVGLLEAASKGTSFRCVEYAAVVAGCLNAIGIPARAVGAMSSDVETRRINAGHVFAEAWLPDAKRWVFVDAEEDVVATAVDGTPLNAVEFRQALASPKPPIDYRPALSMCMFHFQMDLDQRYPLDARQRGDIMLAPVGTAAPTKFQREPSPPPRRFTHRPADLYAAPILER